MGGKRTRKRLHVLFHVACILMFIVSACSRLPGIRLNEHDYFERADVLMNEGAYGASLKEVESVLKRFPERVGDQALYRMGLIYVHPGNREADEQRGLNSFQRILDEYPSSILRERARLWVLTIGKMHRSQESVRALNAKITWLEKALEEKDKSIHASDAAQKKDSETIKSLRSKIATMESQVYDLKGQMEKLKKVDLGIEEKKRKLLH